MGDFRELRLLMQAASADLRMGVFAGRDHLVVPVVMLIGDSVIHTSTSEHPELVPAFDIAMSVPGWNDRAVVGDHPSLNGVRVAASSPEILDTRSFGRLFNARIVNNKLMADAWLDPLKASNIGSDAVGVIQRALDGEPIEVSVGCFVSVEASHGVQNGKKYFGVWHDIMPDHLAMLPEGVKGACSNEMGCGAPRAAARYLVGADGSITEEAVMNEKKNLLERVRAFLAAFESVSEAVSEEPVAAEDETQMEDKPEAEPKAACQCQEPKTEPSAVKSAKEDEMKNVTERVKALIQASAGKLTDADQAGLEAAGEAALTLLEASFAKAVEEPKAVEPKAEEPKAEPKAEEPKGVVISAERLATLEAIADREDKRAKAEHAALVAQLVACGQKAYTEDELKALSIEQLRKTAQLVSVEVATEPVNFGAQAPAPRDAKAEQIPPPVDMTARIKALRQA